MPAGTICKETAKAAGRTVLGFAGMSAVLAKHGLHATDSILGGYVNEMTGAFAGGAGKTPLKDVVLKATNNLLDGLNKTTKSVSKKIKEL